MAETVRIILARIEERVKAMDEKIDSKIADIKEDTLYLRNNNRRQWEAIDENTKVTGFLLKIYKSNYYPYHIMDWSLINKHDTGWTKISPRATVWTKQ